MQHGIGWQEDAGVLRARARAITLFLKQHEWLTSTHVTDFYTESLWERLPHEWRSYLDGIPPADAAHFGGLANEPLALLSFLSSRTPVPDTLRTYMQDLSTLPLCRTPTNEGSSAGGDGCEETAGKDDVGAHVESLQIGQGLGRGMSPKKLHEVSRLSKMVANSLAATRVEGCAMPLVLDIGSGQGYLSRVLAMQRGLDVIGVEADSCNVDAAFRSDEKMRTERTNKGCTESGRISHVPERIEADTAAEDLFRIVQPWLHSSDSGEERGFALVGLHSCGDLVPTMLRVFEQRVEARAVFAVSCCYMKLKTGCKPQGDVRSESTAYPLSEYFKELGTPLGLPDEPMGFHFREQACHSIDGYCQRLRGEGDAVCGQEGGRPGFLHNHCFRAILEVVISELGTRAPRELVCLPPVQGDSSLCKAVRASSEGGMRVRLAGVHKEKPQRHDSFGSYARAILRRASKPSLPLNTGHSKDLHDKEGLGTLQMWVEGEVEKICASDLELVYAEELASWHRAAMFYVLRLMLAPAIESVLLLDRLLFLRAIPGVRAELRPLFDPLLSPRTFTLAAWRV